jgi:hypothetical protein
MKSFADPDTHFEIVESGTPVSVDGFALGEPTGEVRCAECGAVHDNVDEIPHDPTCSQRWVRSRWWAEHLQSA